ncbi:OpgC domain-containing protein [Pikeienuella piscinae]|uniref:OpgC domain-containing protein n=1 Tax=Pikeienuella piscinae TaxID=2748098 RepID=A0A7L5BTA9_9RHOB|nr:OpgC domain-containing protein [Pikeienuella piscinae]QIE54795.1 OpgC domain-containing protein [Pikeienuella piscinae]
MTADGRRPRDLRLDFFRGLAMFIILLAHTPGNTWTLWIPARFGFSDATEIFVFCSGMASALAFGAVFAERSWALGAARVAYRVWQVYWAHIGVFFATALLMVMLDRTGLGPEGAVYADWWPVSGLFHHTKVALVGLFTLTYVPGLFDILPMYLVILAMIPVVMLAHRFGGTYAVFGVVTALWFAAQLALWRRALDGAETHMLGEGLAALGGAFSFLALPSNPWGDGTWFFNPFGWQLVFFTGFALVMKWLPTPPVKRGLVIAAIVYLAFSLPFAWFKIYGDGYLPADWALRIRISEARDFMSPLIEKSGIGPLRYLHFLALAYLSWAAVGPGGVRLTTGWSPPPAVRGLALIGALAVLAILTAPYAYVDEIRAISPSLDAWLLARLQGLGLVAHPMRIGLLQIAHLVALLMLAWAAIGAERRKWLARDGFLALVPVIRKVGTQSLAVFMVSIPLSRFNGWWLDVIGKDVWTRGLVNLTGFAVLIATAYLVGWFKAQPWRQRQIPRAPESSSGPVANPTPAE